MRGTFIIQSKINSKNLDLEVRCVNYMSCLGRVPNVANLNYSDHEGVYGEFQLKEGYIIFAKIFSRNSLKVFYK